MSERRTRPSGNEPGLPPSRNLGTGNSDCGHVASMPAIVAAGARKEKLRQRSWNPPASRREPRPYAELRAASAFSFLDGASLPEDLVEESCRRGLPAVALVDTNGVYGAPRFYKAAREAGLKALVGASIRIENGEWRIKNGGPSSRILNSQFSTLNCSFLTVLVENRTGYKNLCRLITAGALGKEKGATAVSWGEIAAHTDGLHCLTGGDEGPFARALAAGGIEAGRRELAHLAAIFPHRVHVEVARHRLRSEEHRNRAAVSLAGTLRLPLVAANGVRYARPRDKELHDVLTAIREHTTLDRAGRLLAAHRERHVKNAAEMSALFPDLPGALDHAWELSQILDFTLADLGYRFPEYPLPPGETPASYLRHLAWNGARARFRPLTARAQAQ